MEKKILEMRLLGAIIQRESLLKGFAKKHDIIFSMLKIRADLLSTRLPLEPSDIGRYNKTEEKTGRKYFEIDGKGYKRYYLDDGRLIVLIIGTYLL